MERRTLDYERLAKRACAEEERGDGKEHERTWLLSVDKTLQLSKDTEV